MSWRERATPVNQSGGWRSRATPISVQKPEEDPGLIESYQRSTPYAFSPVGMLNQIPQLASQATSKLGAMARNEIESSGDIGSGMLGSGVEKAIKYGPDVAMFAFPEAPAAKAIASTPKTILKPAGSFARKAMGALFGPSEKAIAARLERPSELASAKKIVDLGDDLAGSLETIKGQVKKGSEAAAKTLNPDLFNSPGVQTKGTVLKRITNLQNELRTGGVVVGEAEQMAFKKLEALKGRIKSMTDGKEGLFNNRISEQNIEGIIKSIDPDINWDSALHSVSNEKLMRLRTLLDRSLKIKNPQYREAIKPVAERMHVLEGSRKKFNIRSGEGGKFTPDNATASNLEQALNEKKSVSRELLEGVKKFTKRDYLREAENSKLAGEFSPDVERSRGSSRTILGATVGATAGGLLGGPLGSAAGSAIGGGVGRIVDRQGGAIAGKIIDAYLKGGGFAGALEMKYGPAFLKAAEEGSAAVTTLHKELAQTDPAYKKFAFEILNTEGRSILRPKKLPKPMFRAVGNLAEDVNAVQEPLKVLDESTARAFLKQAKGDKEMARNLAREAGYQW